MWCGKKGIDCIDCGVFGECKRSCCGLPNAEPSILGTSSSYIVYDTTSKKLINDIKYDAVKEFAEKLKKYSYTDNCFTDGKWHRYVLVSDIDELVNEYENDRPRLLLDN